MKLTIIVSILFLFGCAKPESKFGLVATQHAGRGVINGDMCQAMYSESGRSVKTPGGFTISPYNMLIIAKVKLGYNCGHKLGAKILSDKNNYYIVRLGNLQDAIVINGKDGSIVSKGFLGRPQ